MSHAARPDPAQSSRRSLGQVRHSSTHLARTLSTHLGTWLLALSVVLLIASPLLAQERPSRRPRSGGQRVVAQPNANKQPESKPGGGEKKPEGEQKKEDEKKDKEKEEAAASSIKRPKQPPRVPDPREFDVRPDKTDRLQFAFYGQPWPDVLQWLANIGGHDFDWQELPDDYINFSADRKYTVAETRDVFNRLLLERGFTMVLQGEVMLVTKVSNLDPSLVPRVEDESQLLDLAPHDFVKFTFQLPDELKADQAAEDVKQLLSRHAKVHPLQATNRLLVIDIVANLRDVSQLINAEHAAATGKEVPREFTIQYARAERVADQVMILLGLNPSDRRTPQELQLEMQRMQILSGEQKKGRDISKFITKGGGPAVYLAVNYRRNSILANAPPAEMATIERAVRMLDVPSGSLVGTTPQTLSMKKYTLVTLSPQSIVSTLEQIGELDPRTQLKIDTGSKTVFAYATLADHEKINAMIDRLDGTGRQLEVIWLRRLPADAVAVTIHSLMVGEEEEDDNRSRRYSWYFSRYDDDKEDEQPNKGFRVDADIENNRLLLYANEAELKEVRSFLVKLGEIPGGAGNPSTVRVLEPRSVEATTRLIDQLRKTWPSIGPNELKIEQSPQPAEEEQESQDASDKATRLPLQPGHAVAIARPGSGSGPRPDSLLLTQIAAPGGRAAGEQQPRAERPDQEPPPITISIAEDGRIVLSCPDPQVLDRMEELLARIAPPAKDYKVFYLENALASWVTLNLEEYFEEDEDSESSSGGYWFGWYDYDRRQQQDSGVGGLNKRRKIRFIWDSDTNSILVSNATPQQLATVTELIKIYDKAPSEDSLSARQFQIFKIEYSRASLVAETVKDVFRDLLSSKDKAFEKEGGDKKKEGSTSNYFRVYGNMDGGDDKSNARKVKASFAGALSIGVDEVSNTVIVSAQEEWMPTIATMIQHLDDEARKSIPAIQVVPTGVNVEGLQAALARAFPQPRAQQEAAKPGAQQPQVKGGRAPEAAKDGKGKAATSTQTNSSSE